MKSLKSINHESLNLQKEVSAERESLLRRELRRAIAQQNAKVERMKPEGYVSEFLTGKSPDVYSVIKSLGGQNEVYIERAEVELAKLKHAYKSLFEEEYVFDQKDLNDHPVMGIVEKAPSMI